MAEGRRRGGVNPREGGVCDNREGGGGVVRREVAVAVRPVVRGEAGGAAPARTVPVARPVITRCRPGLFDVLGLTAWGGRGGGGVIGGGRARIGMRRGFRDLSLL